MTDAAVSSAPTDFHSYRASLRVQIVPPEAARPLPTPARFRSDLARNQLVKIDEDDQNIPYQIGVGPVADAEKCLALADGPGALNVAKSIFTFDTDWSVFAPPLSDDAATALNIAARAYLMMGNVEQARILLESHKTDTRLNVAAAAMALAQNRLSDAEALLQVAKQQQPDAISVYYTLALLRVSQRRLDEARALFADIARSMPEHAVARYQLGQLVAAAGDSARAGTLFEMAASLAPHFIAPLLVLAEMMMESRLFGEALNLLEQAKTRAPWASSPLLMQTRLMLEMGNPVAAQHLAEAAMQRFPDETEAVILWSEALIDMNRAADAVPRLEQSLQTAKPADASKALRLLARIALNQRPPRFEDASSHLQKAIQLATDPEELYLEAAHVAVAAQRPRDAQKYLEAIRDDPRCSVHTQLSGAAMARHNGFYHLARQLALQALPRLQNPTAINHVTNFLYALDDAEKAAVQNDETTARFDSLNEADDAVDEVGEVDGEENLGADQHDSHDNNGNAGAMVAADLVDEAIHDDKSTAVVDEVDEVEPTEDATDHVQEIPAPVVLASDDV